MDIIDRKWLMITLFERQATKENILYKLKTGLNSLQSLAKIAFCDELRYSLFLKEYNPDQPRAPAGEPNGGQWIGEGGASLI